MQMFLFTLIILMLHKTLTYLHLERLSVVCMLELLHACCVNTPESYICKYIVRFYGDRQSRKITGRVWPKAIVLIIVICRYFILL